MLDQLQSLIWRRLRLSLRNERNTHAKEPPRSIFQSIFKQAATSTVCGGPPVFCFHPVNNYLPERINRGVLYELELVFPTADTDLIGRFVQALQQHLADWRNNFSMHRISAVEERCLAAVMADLPADAMQASELCLNFLTHLRFKPKSENRPWLLDKDDFFSGCVSRINKLFGADLAADAGLWRDINLMPYFWRYDNRQRHEAKSSPGFRGLNGATGPLYLKGDMTPVLPLLAVCADMHAGLSPSYGEGYYSIETGRPFFDSRLRNPAWFMSAWERIEEKSDIARETVKVFLDRDAGLEQLHTAMVGGDYRPEPCPVTDIVKPRGGNRSICSLAPADYIVHKVLHHLVQDCFDRMFEDASVAYRKRKSRDDARRMIAQAYKEGLTYVVESDIESFFDQIDWDILMAKLRQSLPQADTLTLQLLDAAIKTDTRSGGYVQHRSLGLLQGSPLSPLLANLYLDSFDEAMQEKYRLIRYGDDFLLLVRDADEAVCALADMRQALAVLKLTVNEEKTAVQPVDMGFTFLGYAIPGDIDEDFVEKTTLRKTLFIMQEYGFVGIDHDVLVVRKAEQTLARLPIKRIGEIIIQGSNTVSTALLHRCSSERIPVSFCTAAGYYINTLTPDSRRHFEIVTCHGRRHAGLPQQALAGLAARIVEAKLATYDAWVRERRDAERAELLNALAQCRAGLTKAQTVEQVRGHEGAAAALMFPFVNARAVEKEPLFASPVRRPRERPDRYNSLLDFGYSLLFARLNVLVRGSGMNPYLGFLHSGFTTAEPDACSCEEEEARRDVWESGMGSFETFVCDLQEPFRCRIDRMVLRLINLQIIKADDFEKRPAKKNGASEEFWLKREAAGRFVEAFEREIATTQAGDGSSFGQLLSAQVKAALGWVNGAETFEIYRGPKQREPLR